MKTRTKLETSLTSYAKAILDLARGLLLVGFTALCTSAVCNSNPLTVADWQYSSWQHSSPSPPVEYPPGPGVFEETTEGLKFYDYGSRGLSKIVSKESFNLAKSTLYVKWKVNGNGGWAYFTIGILGQDWTQRFTWLSPQYSYAGTVVIANDTWYYTRIAFDPLLNFTSVTSANTYDDQGGSIVQTMTGGRSSSGGNDGKILIAFEDTYAASVSTVVGEVNITPKVAFRTLPDHQPNPSAGRQAVESFQMTPGGQCSFIFSTADPGSMCHISWTNNLRQWFPLIQFNTADKGTEVIDTPRDPSKFYRATYLPSGVSSADSFDYPIASGSVSEQIVPERNTLYPSSAVSSPDRGASAPNTGNWYNYQDVGSYYAYYSTEADKWYFEGLHPGEDWNKGSGAADAGQPIKAVANGQVIDIRPAHSSGAANSGFVVLVRHWLLNGDTMDSLYVHVAPDKISGSTNASGAFGAESDFSFQEGSPVTKGSVIGVVGAVTSTAMSPHLHFEMRTTQTVPSNIWPNDTGDGYYGPVPETAGNRSPSITTEEVQAAFLLMQKDGIIDPSDFIDDNR